MSRTRSILSAALLLALPAALAAQSEIQRTVEARPDGVVRIANVAGSVTVAGWDRDEVEVTGSVGRGVEEVEVESRGGTVEIEVDLVRHSRGRDADARLEIRVPRASDLDVETVSAEVEVAGVEGDVTVESVSGSVEVEGRVGDLDVETVSGSIEVDAGAEEASLESVSGAIRFAGETRAIEAATVSGRIEIDTGELRRAELETTSGRIALACALAAGAEVEIDSHSGSVELALRGATSARFSVATYSGRIANQLGPAPSGSRYGPSQELEFSLGGGDARVEIETFSGSVQLRRRD